MPRATPIQPSFNAGELSPRMVARTDFAKYPLGCATLENMILLPQGGAARRPGTLFIAEAKDSTKRPRLIAFEFSTLQAYVLEAGDRYFRFYKDQGQIVVDNTDAAISNGAFASDLTGWTDQSAGAGSISWNASGSMDLDAGGAGNEAHAEQSVTTTSTGQDHVLRFRVVGDAEDSVKLRVGTSTTGNELVDDVAFTTGWHAYAFTPSASPFYVQFRNETDKTAAIDDVSLIDNAPVEIAGPYLEAELAELKFAQSADTLYVCHQLHPVHRLTRSGHSSWSLSQVLFSDGPYKLENSESTTLIPSAVTGNGITITASATTGLNDGAGFESGDIGRLIRIKHGNIWGHAVITGINSTTIVTADVKIDFGAITAQSAWRLGAWSGRTGFPSAISFFEQRLAFAGSSTQPQTFWMSQSADFVNMAPDSPGAGGGAPVVEDDDALDYTISADQVNAIRWMSPGRQLLIGTVGGEWVAKSNGPVLTPIDIDVKRQTTYGSGHTAPQQMRGRMLFLQRATRKILEFSFSFELDNFRALDLTILSDHVTKSGIADMAYQQELESTLWCVRNDGQLATLAYQPDQEVVGWARQIIGGAFGSGNAVVESAASIPAATQDEIWIVCKRTINGITKRYIECFAAPYENAADQADATYVDSALSYGGAATQSLSGLDHLEGETVSILADGAVHPDKPVTGGVVTLDYPASKVTAGLGYTHLFESLKWEAGSATGTAQGQTKRIHGVTVVLLDALSAEIGPSLNTLRTISFREVDDAMDTAIPLFSGEKYIEFDADFATDTRVMIRGSTPTPFTLLAVAPNLKTNTR